MVGTQEVVVEQSHEPLKQPQSKIAILNFRSQHSLEILDSCRNQGVSADVLPFDVLAGELEGYSGIVFSGGDGSVYDVGSPRPDPRIYELNKPIFGICYGAQLIAQEFGGQVVPGHVSEFGQHTITKASKEPASVVFAETQATQEVWMNHGDRITGVADDWEVTSHSENGMVASFSSPDSKYIGVQFHPEVQGEGRTVGAEDMWARYLFDVVKVEPDFEPESIEKRIDRIREQVGDRQVLAFLSGGVDSTVMAALLAKALPPEQIYAVHVDHGFMRDGESDEVVEALTAMGVKVHHMDASEYFLRSSTMLKGKRTGILRRTVDPEEKRSITGDAFIRFQKRAAKKLGLRDDYVLAQGTIRPDRIESGSHGTTTIKSHHNDTALARAMRALGRVIEPLDDLYKPGVRAVGRALGLPDALIKRQPFPGPGGIVRILCRDNSEITPEEVKDLKKTARSLGKVASGTMGVTVIPVRSVGQRAEGRSYGQTVVVTGVGTWDEKFSLSKRITGSSKDINRVAYAFGDKIDEPYITNVTKTMPDRRSAKLWRKADKIVREELTKAGLDDLLQQVPVVLLPSGIDKAKKRSVVVRPFSTINYVTGTAPQPGTEYMPEDVLNVIVERLLAIKGISRVLYDMTNKPPGTTEWE